ncbi:serine/threonine-protein kinase PLK1-like [Stegodyphus dumicola]|uniref:serine/threonine-protein kinase PLK1-like n=1 Tax=Stegodyphus dumicola TaxID=202533 RepID=UPI0015B0FEBF|nr:serine/threonine-protein kinase PLK1-like [Stegodyphus dumicola]
MSTRQKYEELKPIIIDSKSNTTYRRGNFLGKGGFARCYEFKNTKTGEVFAGKVVSKSMLVKPHHRDKMCQEIAIHKSLSHMYIVALHSYFEDESNMYIVLELCRKRSLMEMCKRRKTLTIPEVRYFMRQIVLACQYMHDNKVIHRDLKLGNLFINDNMEIKVGDFGLATRIAFDGERKLTVCGTPNYIAPEILMKKGHSFEVDVWSLGCIMYTLLIGSPPFETKALKNTYAKIKKCEYYLPSRLDHSAKQLIQKLLHLDPQHRPNVNEILMDDFLTSGYIPSRLPASCLTMQPRAANNISMCEKSSVFDRKPLTETGNKPVSIPELTAAIRNMKINPSDEMPVAKPNFDDLCMPETTMPKDFHLSDLYKMLESVVKCNPELIYTGQSEDAQDPSAVPFIWISKWVDYTDKYGLGYQLSDNSIGVLFNDLTHLILLGNCENLQYIDRNDEEQFFTITKYPEDMNKKVTLLKYFNGYMTENLVKAGENAKLQDDDMANVPHLRAWFRTKSAIVFHLTNGTFQANFFRDHTKIILCPLMGAVSFIDEHKNFTVYTFKLIAKYGCSQLLASRLRYAKNMVEKLYKDYEYPETVPKKTAP